jgi:hypothetical protein
LLHDGVANPDLGRLVCTYLNFMDVSSVIWQALCCECTQ